MQFAWLDIFKAPGAHSRSSFALPLQAKQLKPRYAPSQCEGGAISKTLKRASQLGRNKLQVKGLLSWHTS